MYCPRCATPNNDEVKYCRACGANLSYVSQAMTGRLPEPRVTGRRRRHRNDFEHGGPPDIANGITKTFMGLAFLLVSACVFFFAPAGRIWWFWMLIPAFALLGKGVAEIVSANVTRTMTPGAAQTAMPPQPFAAELPPRSSYDPLPPPSITEGTTRHLDPTPDRYKNDR